MTRSRSTTQEIQEIRGRLTRLEQQILKIRLKERSRLEKEMIELSQRPDTGIQGVWKRLRIRLTRRSIERTTRRIRTMRGNIYPGKIK